MEASATAGSWWQTTQVVKTLWPPRPGTVGLHRKYAAELVCVRYRHDLTHTCRYTTVELVVEQAPIRHRPAATIEVQIHFLNQEMRARIYAAGGRWDKRKKVWRISRQAAERLGLT